MQFLKPIEFHLPGHVLIRKSNPGIKFMCCSNDIVYQYVHMRMQSLT